MAYDTRSTTADNVAKTHLREPAEVEYAEELEWIRSNDSFPKPKNWKTSPKMICLFILGGKTQDGKTIKTKYWGPRRLIELAVATLATDRALLLYGVPGTAKSRVSELLAAAISGDSKLLVQGTAGTDEGALRYGWNYKQLLTEGPSYNAIVKSPLFHAMEEGKIARVEELTRIASDVQDSLITILSEKTLPIPEINGEQRAFEGFNVIATANNRDRGVNELSSALKRRFNVVTLPTPATLEGEVRIVRERVEEMGRSFNYPVEKPADRELLRVVTIFRELRAGMTLDGKNQLKIPSGTLSPAEAISVVNNALANAAYFGTGKMKSSDLAPALVGAIVQDPTVDAVPWRDYLNGVMRERADWKDLYDACKGIDV